MRPKLARWIIAGVLLAVACLGIKYRWLWLVSVVVTLSVAVYLAGMVRAVTAQGRSRVTSMAFTLVGAIYLALVSGQMFREPLVTQNGLALLWQGAWKANIFIPANPDEMVEMTNYNPGSLAEVLDLFARCLERRHTAERRAAFAFVTIGHCVLSWIFAGLAGWIAGRMYDRRERAMRAVE